MKLKHENKTSSARKNADSLYAMLICMLISLRARDRPATCLAT